MIDEVIIGDGVDIARVVDVAVLGNMTVFASCGG